MGLDLGKCQDVARVGLLICLIKIPYAKLIRAQIFSWWSVGFSAGVI